MTDLFQDGSVRLSIRKKLNNSIGALKINETTTTIPAGYIGSIPVNAAPGNQLFAGSVITLVDTDTGESHDLTLSSNFTNGQTSIRINSHLFETDVQAGSPIFYKMTDLLSKLYGVI